MAENTQQHARKNTERAQGGEQSTRVRHNATFHAIPNYLAAGNQAIQSLLQARSIQAQLKIGNPNDPLEREADSVAANVMSGSAINTNLHFANLQSAGSGVQRKCSVCEDENPSVVQRKQTSSTAPHAPGSEVSAKLSNFSRGGTEIGKGERSFFESRFGRSFNDVRVHTDTSAASATNAINARAFTLGNHIAFAPGEYAPASARGKTLLAHELTHVIQQQASGDKILRRAPEDGQTYTIALPFTSGDIVLEGGETIVVVDWQEGEDSARVQLPAPYINAYVPFTIPKIYIQRGQVGQVGQAEPTEPTIISSIPIQFEAEMLGDLGAGLNGGLDLSALNLQGLNLGGGGVQPGASPSSGISSISDTPIVGSSFFSAGMASNALAMGHHGFLSGGNAPMTRSGIMRYMMSSDYWGPMIPRAGDITLDRVGNTFPRNLQPRMVTEPGGWFGGKDLIRMPFSDQELDSIADLVRRYSQNPASLAPDELALLRRAATTHINGAAMGSPLASYMTPDHNVGWHPRYRVRVQMPSGSILDVSVPNAFNNLGDIGDVYNPGEMEFLASANNEGRIISVQRHSATTPPGFLMRNANTIRWGGRIVVVAGAAYSGHRIATASEEERPRVVGEEVGSMALGAAGTSLAVAGCVALGVATGGVALFVCGLTGGIVGGALGNYGGGAIGEAVGPSPVQDAANFVVQGVVDSAMSSGNEQVGNDAVAVRDWWFSGDLMSEVYIVQRIQSMLMGR